jgi:hypothetical protein
LANRAEGGRDLGVAGADDVGASELGGEADEVAAERLVAVEAAVVCPHALAAPRAVEGAAVGGSRGRVDPQPLGRGAGGREERRHGGERVPDLRSPEAKEGRSDGSLRQPEGGEHTFLRWP